MKGRSSPTDIVPLADSTTKQSPSNEAAPFNMSIVQECRCRRAALLPKAALPPKVVQRHSCPDTPPH
ncbi:MAG: hypothetical protein LBG27_05915 [Spirochaetaceae bacterium]|nr:hypothetical protein [Spirochaetaceae bacterium]